MTQLGTKPKVVMVTAFTFSPFFGSLVFMLFYTSLTSEVYGFLGILNISLQYAIFGLTLYFLPATLIGLIFNKQIFPLKQSILLKILMTALIGLVISALWAMLFGYFYVGNISEKLADYIQLVLGFGAFGAVISAVVAALIFKFQFKFMQSSPLSQSTLKL
ncbi:hypothetical protein EC844_11379 [Acinetobacter calcoaceticus]|uniref:Uncharacterized protein n=1 Tax=Acinetobacter calcoaceticus TaxID=471 RepID=A0A4R1XSF1_ACICA|nr:hypothetical protein EC844_11379 [Acinetobacter calcoaceticus]